jgi:hypothetical protein
MRLRHGAIRIEERFKIQRETDYVLFGFFAVAVAVQAQRI